jgi:hypothetical protein
MRYCHTDLVNMVRILLHNRRMSLWRTPGWFGMLQKKMRLQHGTEVRGCECVHLGKAHECMGVQIRRSRIIRVQKSNKK